MRLGVIVILLAARVAAADPTVGAIVTGEPTLQTPVRAQIEAWARAHEYVAVDRPLGEHAKTFIDCFVIEDIKCAHGVFEKQSTADGVFLVHVELIAGQTRELAFTGYWFVKGHDAIAEKRACPSLPGQDCDDAAQRAALSSLLDALARQVVLAVPARETDGRSRLLPGVAIGVGAGLVVGGTTYLYYGHKGGRDAPYQYPDATKLGVALTVTGALAIAGGSVLWRTATPREKTLVPVVLLAAGAAALGGGALALSYAAKRGPNEAFVYPDAAKLGAPLAIAGGSAMAAGAILLVWGRAPSGSLQASVTPGGGTIGWAGQL